MNNINNVNSNVGENQLTPNWNVQPVGGESLTVDEAGVALRQAWKELDLFVKAFE